MQIISPNGYRTIEQTLSKKVYDIDELEENPPDFVTNAKTSFFGLLEKYGLPKPNIVYSSLNQCDCTEIETHFSTFAIPPAKPKNESDPTGAGDAYRAGFLAGYFRGLPLDICGKMGSLASVYTVEKYGTQTHKFTIREFAIRYKNSFDEILVM